MLASTPPSPRRDGKPAPPPNSLRLNITRRYSSAGHEAGSLKAIPAVRRRWNRRARPKYPKRRYQEGFEPDRRSGRRQSSASKIYDRRIDAVVDGGVGSGRPEKHI